MVEPVRRVAVTGAAGYIGRRFVWRLEEDDEVERVLAIDVLPMAEDASSKVVFLQQDITRPISSDLSEHDIDAVVHLAFLMGPGRDRSRYRDINVGGAAQVFRSCVDADVRHIVYLSSSTVYGARRDNPPALTEESPVRPLRGFHYGEDKAEVEGLLRELVEEHPHVTSTVLRACPVVGPTADNFIARAFTRSFLIGVSGQDPELQLCHEDDAVEVVRACTLGRSAGVYNLAGDGMIRWSEMARTIGSRLVTLPAWAVYPLIELTWRLRLQGESPAVGLDFVRYPWVVSTDKLRRELSITPVYSSKEAWGSFAPLKQEART